MSLVITFLLVSILGLIVGSFLSAISYRLPRGIKITKGRSFCDKCKEKISWRDNIPIFSFYFLGGKCRNCGTPISLRYPLIEFFTLDLYLIITLVFTSCATSIEGSVICQERALLGFWALPYLLILASGFMAIFIIDLESQTIPDSISLGFFAFSSLILIIFNPDYAYQNFLSAFAGSSFLLLIHLFTKGKGMGLGDVKLALLGGVVLGWPSTVAWLILSFVIGALVGLILILAKKAEFGKRIAFGPFLVFSFFIALIWGEGLIQAIFRL